uniref:Uncharacterized protein n=1 Tax=Anguilla anguilla TaxID=7936 RepID=A0A0E9PU91_ANGAN
MLTNAKKSGTVHFN